jgi:hypothetical protein
MHPRKFGVNRIKKFRMPEIYVDMLEAFPQFRQTTKAISKIRMKRAKSSSTNWSKKSLKFTFQNFHPTNRHHQNELFRTTSKIYNLPLY